MLQRYPPSSISDKPHIHYLILCVSPLHNKRYHVVSSAIQQHLHYADLTGRPVNRISEAGELLKQLTPAVAGYCIGRLLISEIMGSVEIRTGAGTIAHCQPCKRPFVIGYSIISIDIQGTVIRVEGL